MIFPFRKLLTLRLYYIIIFSESMLYLQRKIKNRRYAMKDYTDILKKTPLFAGVAEADIHSMLGCLQAQIKKYKKGEYVLSAGDETHSILVLCEGRLLIQSDDYWGNRSIIADVEPGGSFGEAYAAPGGGVMQCDVAAVCDSTVMLFDIERVLTVCPHACGFHTLAVQNLFYSISEKNRRLTAKLGHMAQRTTREKLMSYLSEESRRQGSDEFTIPYNRQQLADYLAVDRSAMSAELCRMRADGLVEFERSRFKLSQ